RRRGRPYPGPHAPGAALHRLDDDGHHLHIPVVEDAPARHRLRYRRVVGADLEADPRHIAAPKPDVPGRAGDPGGHAEPLVRAGHVARPVVHPVALATRDELHAVDAPAGHLVGRPRDRVVGALPAVGGTVHRLVHAAPLARGGAADRRPFPGGDPAFTREA